MKADRGAENTAGRTIAGFRPDRVGTPSPSGHGQWLLDSPADLGPLLAGDPASVLPPAWRERARARIREQPPLPCRGLQRVEIDGPRLTLGFAIGLDRADRRSLGAACDRLPERPPGPCLVIGAGLAGVAMAHALARRGRAVVVVDAGPQPGGALRDVPLAAQHPSLSADDNIRSRLSRAALMSAWRLRAQYGPAMQWCGRDQAVGDTQRRDRLLAGWPEPLASASDGGAIRFPRCGLLDTGAWFAQVAAMPGIALRSGRTVAQLAHGPTGWAIRLDDGEVIGDPDYTAGGGTAGGGTAGGGAPDGGAPGGFGAVIVACPAHRHLSGLAPPWTAPGSIDAGHVLVGHRAVGQWPSGAAARIHGASSDDGNDFRLELPPWIVIGARDDATEPITAAESGVRWRLSAPAPRFDPPDHLPMIGAVPDQAAIVANAAAHHRNDRLPYPLRPDLYLLTGLGGRGLLWSHLGAEIIAATIAGEPPVVEASLAAAVDPGRFLRRRLRRTGVTWHRGREPGP